jgi:N-formylglutamate amidohydrolase
VPSRTQQHGYLWRRPISAAQLGERLDQAHRPYHSAIDELISMVVDRFGCALLIDCHSMPPPPKGTPPIIFGDCRGRTAERWMSEAALEVARRCGFEPGLNDPFAGGHVIERHARPWHNVHALQLEIDRRCYLDETLREPGPGFDDVAAFIDTLAQDLGEALLGQQFATAAE